MMAIDSYHVRKLIREVEEGRLEVKAFFQRRLVWTTRDKEFFIDTVLQGYPCPEIFVATTSIEKKSLKFRTWLVDGQQRVTTLVDYFKGNLKPKDGKAFDDLDEAAQERFLGYEVAVRDLGAVTDDQIREIFRRINSTDYALKSMEMLNAMYSGEYKAFCETLSRHTFFREHKVFPEAYVKRMYDVTFCVILVTTLLADYYRRDERNAEYLERYNDAFPQQDEINKQLDQVFAFVDACGFDEKSRVWGQTDLLTLLVELHSILVIHKLPLDAIAVGQRLRIFYNHVNDLYRGKRLPDETQVPSGQEEVFKYLKAATKASNDKYARVARAEVISGLILSTVSEDVLQLSVAMGMRLGRSGAEVVTDVEPSSEAKPKKRPPKHKSKAKTTD